MLMNKSLLLCMILVLAGCEKAPEQAATEDSMENATSTDIPAEGPGKDVNISRETDKGKFTFSSGEGVEMPKAFPDDVFIYQPSRLITAMDMPDGGVLGLTTTDSTSTIAETYKREMSDRNWSVQTSVQNDAQLMLVFEKEKRIANITIGTQGDASQIMLTVSKN